MQAHLLEAARFGSQRLAIPYLGEHLQDHKEDLLAVIGEGLHG